jgi:hypothetical protein
MRLVGDLEADALLDDVTTVHCLVLKDLDTMDIHRFNQQGGPSIEDGIELMSKADALYFHNGIRYDYAVLEKLYPTEWARVKGVTLLDTLVLAHIRFIHVKETDYDTLVKQGKMPKRQAGLHNLEAWGYRLGVHKAGYDGGWESWNQAMEDYCVQDVEVTHALIDHLRKAGVPAQAVEMEHRLQAYLFKQEMNGWCFDLPKAAALQARLAGRREDIGSQLIDAFGWWYAADGAPVTPARSMVRRKGMPCPGGGVQAEQQTTHRQGDAGAVRLEAIRVHSLWATQGGRVRTRGDRLARGPSAPRVPAAGQAAGCDQRGAASVDYPRPP